MTTRSQQAAEKIRNLLKARNHVLWVRTNEEHRVEPWLFTAAGNASYEPRTWDVAAGICKMDGRPLYENPITQQETRDPGAVLGMVANAARDTTANAKRYCWIMRDLPAFLTGPGAAPTVRQLRNVARMFPPLDRAQPIIIITPSGEVPPELAGHVTVLDWPLPDREEIGALLDAAIKNLKPELQEAAAPNGVREQAIDAAVGLSGFEAENCYAASLVELKGKIDPAIITQEKKRIIAASGVLEWMEPLEGGFDAIGGLDVLKAWTITRKQAFSKRARAYGVPSPRGVFFLGISGCGKTYSAKAIAYEFGRVPLFRFDIGAMKSKYVGDSEAKIRRALATIDNTGPCVVLIDEIEKALAGATQGAADGGVSADALGTLLTWMQERKSQAFLVATSNDITQMPPELLRKGRWDELFWCDLPNASERAAIIKATLRTYGRKAEVKPEALAKLAAATEGFSGAELAALVPDALFVGFADGEREITLQDLLNAAKTVTPLAKTASEKITKMREWAKGKARPATTPESESERTTTGARTLDI